MVLEALRLLEEMEAEEMVLEKEKDQMDLLTLVEAVEVVQQIINCHLQVDLEL